MKTTTAPSPALIPRDPLAEYRARGIVTPSTVPRDCRRFPKITPRGGTVSEFAMGRHR